MCEHNDRDMDCARCQGQRSADAMASLARTFVTVEQAAKGLLAGIKASGYETETPPEVMQIAIDLPVSQFVAKVVWRSLGGNIVAARKLCELSDLGYSEVQICAAARGINQAPSSAPVGR